MRPLTTTSYAILAQLALKSWSAYELAEQRARYFQYMWPRAASGVYRELKRLAEIGLTSAERADVGNRPRTVYSITSEGRQTLEEWLATPVARIELEFEALLRIFMAPLGTHKELLATLHQVRAEADEMIAFGDAIRREYLEGQAPFQEQIHVRVLVVDFLMHFLVTIQEWSDRTRAEVENWDNLLPNGKTDRALELMESLDPQRLRRPNQPPTPRRGGTPTNAPPAGRTDTLRRIG